ncbi:MAG: YfiR family protein [Cyclobacteriaceae bacterium]|nr:YfiR family protein [Cyclobacteriaceae bacterium]
MQRVKIKIAIFITLLMAGNALAQTTNYKTYAVVLYSFTKYIEWPVESKQGDFVIAVFGNSKMASELQNSMVGRKVGTQLVRIVEAKSLSELSDAQVIFVGDLKSGSTAEVVALTKSKPVLVVTERDGLVKKGACVSFLVTDDGLLKFQLNDQALSDQRLKAASALTALAYRGS